MLTLEIQDAEAQLSELVDRAANGESFIITRAGKPLVKMVPFDTRPPTKHKRIGFAEGMFDVPDDFDTIPICSGRDVERPA